VPFRVVTLVSGRGSTLQALLTASRDPAYGVAMVAVGSDRVGAAALELAAADGVSTFVVSPDGFADRPSWDDALTGQVAAHRPDLVLLAGFMRLVGPAFLDAFGGRCVNTHPALLPAFPGMHGPRDALEYGVKVSGCTLILVDSGVDTGPVLAQAAVPVHDDDDEASLHERIKAAERATLVDVVGRMARSGWSIHGRRVTVP
jgi:phosphoribosylglycinamide formyltransferase 1